MKNHQEELNEEFERFIEFGTILDRKTRTYLVQYLKAKYDKHVEFPANLQSTYYEYLCKALDRIFDREELTSLLREKPVLAKQVSTDTLTWIKKAYRDIQTKNPFEQETERLEAYNIMPVSRWTTTWYAVTNYVQSVYERQEIDTGFYAQKFKGLIKGRSYEELDEESKWEIKRISQDLLAQWDALLQAKLLEYQLKKLEESQESFKELLEAKVEEYQKLLKIISPFAEYTGKYWDMSRALWEDTSFDVLKQYDDLLSNEASIKELADMLGKMREAEIETEEEELERVIVRKQWYEDNTLKSEIVGVHESDDINNLLSSEIALLSDPVTETAFLKKFADKELMTFQYLDKQLVTSEHHFTEVDQRVKKKDKGPFIICVDTSDSMSGTPEHIAKILCFAILKMAAKENRRAYLINFSVGIKTIDLFNIADSLEAIANFLRMSFSAGTDISLALYEVFRQLEGENYRDADVLVISDFIMYKLDQDIISRVKYHQQNGNTQFHSLILNNDPNAEVVSHFDNVWLYDPEQKGIIRNLAGNLRDIRDREL